jgi:competence protein ComEC
MLRRFDLSGLPKWSRPVLSVVLSSFVAGLATAPFGAAYFNQIAQYGLIANVLSVPLMGALVMPAAVLAVVLAPLGLWGVGLWLMDVGLRWILFVASAVAAREGALGYVRAPDWFVLPILSLGLLWLVLVSGRGRFAGIALVLSAVFFWQQTARPDLLVADNGALIGLQGPEGRILSKPTGSGFVAGVWLENDGGPVPQAQAAAREGLITEGRVTTAMIGEWRVLQVSGKTALAGVAGCGGADVLISNQLDGGTRPCLVYDLARLRNTGALAFSLAPNGDLLIDTAYAAAGRRPWNRWQGDLPDPVRLSLAQSKRAVNTALLSENRQNQ